MGCPADPGSVGEHFTPCRSSSGFTFQCPCDSADVCEADVLATAFKAPDAESGKFAASLGRCSLPAHRCSRCLRLDQSAHTFSMQFATFEKFEERRGPYERTSRKSMH